MHRAISGDLQNEEEMDRAMEEAGEEGIYQVRNTWFATWQNRYTDEIQCINVHILHCHCQVEIL